MSNRKLTPKDLAYGAPAAYPVVDGGRAHPTPASVCGGYTPVAGQMQPAAAYPPAAGQMQPAVAYPPAAGQMQPPAAYPSVNPGYPAAPSGAYPPAAPGSGFPPAAPGSGFPPAPPGSGYPAFPAMPGFQQPGSQHYAPYPP